MKTFTDITVDDNTSYYYIVKAKNGVVSSSSSNEVMLHTILGSSTLAAPVACNELDINGGSYLHWSAVPGATHYVVVGCDADGSGERGMFVDAFTGLSSVECPYNLGDTGVKDYWKVYAYNATGYSDYSNVCPIHINTCS